MHRTLTSMWSTYRSRLCTTNRSATTSINCRHPSLCPASRSTACAPLPGHSSSTPPLFGKRCGPKVHALLISPLPLHPPRSRPRLLRRKANSDWLGCFTRANRCASLPPALECRSGPESQTPPLTRNRPPHGALRSNATVSRISRIRLLSTDVLELLCHSDSASARELSSNIAMTRDQRS